MVVAGDQSVVVAAAGILLAVVVVAAGVLLAVVVAAAAAEVLLAVVVVVVAAGEPRGLLRARGGCAPRGHAGCRGIGFERGAQPSRGGWRRLEVWSVTL